MSSAAVRPKVVGTAGRPVGHGERRNDVRTTAEPARAGTAIEAEVSAAYDQHGKALLRFALDKTGGDRQLAEEVVQETMVRFWRSAGEVDSIRTLRPWLFTVAKRIAIDRHRRRAARPEEVESAGLEEMAAMDELDRKLTAHIVADAVRALPQVHRETVVEFYFRGRKISDVAQLLDVPVGTVKSRIYYALRALRTILEERGVTGVV